jgi:hypothetical protein
VTHPDEPTSPLGARALSLVASRALLGVDALALVLSAANVHGPLRFVVGMVFGALVPGWALVGLVRLDNATLEVSLSVATSLALLLVLAQAMTALGAWHPIALEEIVGVACVPSLVWLSRERPRRRARQ